MTSETAAWTACRSSSLGAALDDSQAPVYIADQSLMNEIAGFDIHRGCLALAARQPERRLDRAVAEPEVVAGEARPQDQPASRADVS